MSPRRADYQSRGALLNVLCLECDREAQTVRRSRPLRAVAPCGGKKNHTVLLPSGRLTNYIGAGFLDTKVSFLNLET